MLTPGVSSAQSASSNPVQLSTFTNVALGSGTLPSTGSNSGGSAASSIAIGGEVIYFVTPYVGIGGTFSYQRLSLAGDGGTARLLNAYYGPTAQLRLPLDERSAFTLTGSLGGIHLGLMNTRPDFGDILDLTGLGRYWLAGAGLGFRIAPRATLDIGARYQSSTFRTGQQSTLVSSGLLLGVGVSFWLSS